MFATLPLPNANADPAQALRVYYEVCQPFSAEDVELAVKQFLSGTVKDFNPNYAPTAPKFASQLRANAEYRAATNTSRNLLLEQFKEQELDEQWRDARTPDAKAKVKAMLEAIAEEAKARPDEDPAEVKARMDRHDAHFAGGLFSTETGTTISASLANQIQDLGWATFNVADDDQYDMGGERAA